MISFVLGLYRNGKLSIDRNTLHCNFKGGSTVTNTTTYTATPEEKRMYELNNQMVEKYIPNAERLNNTAANILWDSIGSNQVDFDSLNAKAQQQINEANNGMRGLIRNNNAAAAQTNGSLSGLLPQFSIAANATNGQLASLAEGLLPSTYQQNMEDSIKSGLTNTMGKALNSLGQRGVLNSSVTGNAMNDISKNAADTMAQQYQNNINTVGGLTQQQLGNTNAALEAQSGLTQQQFSNNIGVNEMNSGLYGNLLNSSGVGISTGAAAQEAAQQPALNLWQASLGLTPAGSGALSAVAGKGTTTSTQRQSGGGGGFWGGLASGIGGGLVGLFCFIGGTKIDTPHGKVKIRNIKKGDKVISYNPKTGNDEITEVVKVSEACLEKVYTVQTKDKYGVKHYAVTTASQPFMRPDGSYVTVEKMIIDHTELMGVGVVENIGYSGKQPVYDICTDKCHNYYANGFVAQDGNEFWGKE